MSTLAAPRPVEIAHADLAGGMEFAADVLPTRNTVALVFRMLTGLADEPLELTGINGIIERTLSKGTQRFTGRRTGRCVRCSGRLVVDPERPAKHDRARAVPAGVC